MKKLIAFLVIACMMVCLFVGTVAAEDETEAVEETTAAAEVEETVADDLVVATNPEEDILVAEEESEGPGALQIILLVMQVLSCVALTVIIMFQSSKDNGLGALAGNSGNFMNGKGAATLDAKLASITKWVAAAFVLLTLLVSMLYTVG